MSEIEMGGVNGSKLVGRQIEPAMLGYAASQDIGDEHGLRKGYLYRRGPTMPFRWLAKLALKLHIGRTLVDNRSTGYS